ncbi:hypothetical protein [Puia dinghuensis]|uniref:Uncharacterized protein n=1 Tax=Puia dinghuensis TaxID=1792502 RepID=A0A8J2XPZ9_9BACT|nr:hypothetical protein [Puia dinghuensis]GGA89995.1 hypothetical protein GCM10011511_11550 [Puia dinghuensis]
MAKKRKNTTGHATGKKGKHHHHYGFHGVDHTAPTDKRMIQTAVETGKDLLVGVVGGGLAGAAIGKSSLLVGILVTGAGHFTNNRIVQLLGVGMMASNGFQSSSQGTTSGLDGFDGIKDRLLAYKDSFSQKFYLDKFLKKKPAALPQGTAGIGDVQYFTYPDALSGDLAALSEIENQLAESALEFQGPAGELPEISGELPETTGELPEVAGDLPEVTGELPENAVGDIDDRLY